MEKQREEKEVRAKILRCKPNDQLTVDYRFHKVREGREGRMTMKNILIRDDDYWLNHIGTRLILAGMMGSGLGLIIGGGLVGLIMWLTEGKE